MLKINVAALAGAVLISIRKYVLATAEKAIFVVIFKVLLNGFIIFLSHNKDQ